MTSGDIVKCNWWVHDGKRGIVVEVQAGNYCVGAYVLLECGTIELVSTRNLELINESR